MNIYISVIFIKQQNISQEAHWKVLAIQAYKIT